MPNVEYRPDFFHRKNVDDAKEVILSAGGGMTTDERWERETDWLMERINFGSEHDLVIDYGCGIGRLAKRLKNPVIGVDISQSMRVHADIYVDRVAFGAITPQLLKIMHVNGLCVDGVVSAWALQHVLDVAETIDLLMCMLKPGGVFWLLDLHERHIPCVDAVDGEFLMVDDNMRIAPLIERWCRLDETHVMDIYDQPPDELRKYRRNL